MLIAKACLMSLRGSGFETVLLLLVAFSLAYLFGKLFLCSASFMIIGWRRGVKPIDIAFRCGIATEPFSKAIFADH